MRTNMQQVNQLVLGYASALRNMHLGKHNTGKGTPQSMLSQGVTYLRG